MRSSALVFFESEVDDINIISRAHLFLPSFLPSLFIVLAKKYSRRSHPLAGRSNRRCADAHAAKLSPCNRFFSKGKAGFVL